MKRLLSGLSLIIARKDSRFVIVISTFIFFFLLLLMTNGSAAWQALLFESLTPSKRVFLSINTLLDISNTFSRGPLILAILGSFLGGINISFAYTYIRLRGEMILRSGLYSGLGLFFAFLGIGCAACGTVFLSVFLSLFGFSTMLNLLPYQGEEIGYIGLLILCLASYSLAHKVTAPNVC